jgi:flagellar basal-body rod modification protein FlgD
MNPLVMNSNATPTASGAETVATALSQPRGGHATAKAAAASGTASSGSSSSSSADSSDITANDFLTLLVSELQNQDPTQPADPNAYISQLVGVNSLQQLISINQGLTSIETPASAGSSSVTAPSGTSSNQ